MWIVWVVALLLFLTAEIHTQALYALFVAVGAVAAIIASLLGADVLTQSVVGSVVAILGIIIARPFLHRWMESHREELRLRGTSGSLVGESALTLDDVGDENHPGHALLNGTSWLACVETGVPPLPKDIKVLVAAVRGTTLVVRPSGPLPPALGYDHHAHH
jgi:membrane protein implicated in regulation of membrane protease activity